MLIESDLLVALAKSEDRLREAAERILSGVASGRVENAYASVASLQEVVFWFFNRGLVSEQTVALNALTSLPNLRWVPITPRICLSASLLMKEHGLNPFDAYIAATALAEDGVVLSTEHIYNRINGIERIDPTEFSKGLPKSTSGTS